MKIEQVVSLYEQDEHAWLEQQITLMQSGKLADLDKENLIQYLTEVTIRDRRELRSRIAILLQHLLKIQIQPNCVSRSWIATIVGQQREIRILLESVPSIRTYLPQILPSAYQDAVRSVLKETGISIDRLPAQSPWTLEQALEYNPPIRLSKAIEPPVRRSK